MKILACAATSFAHSIELRITRKPRHVSTFAIPFALLLLAHPAIAGNLVFYSSGGTVTLGSTFTLSNANATSPAGLLTISCPVTDLGGTYVNTYQCNPGGTFTYQSNDGLTSVTGTLTTGDIYETASGGGRGGNIKYNYQMVVNFTGTETLNGISSAIIGESTMDVGGLTKPIGSGSVTGGAGATGINSAYSPIYVTDYSFSQLVRSDDMFGTNKATFGGTGTGVDQFYGPHGLTLDGSGRIYVVDGYNCRIVRIDDMKGANWTTLGRVCGSGANQFTSSATDITVDSSGRIYVADPGNNRIDRFDDMTGTNWTTFSGSGANVLSGASGIALDAAGHIYIADTGNGRIVRMDDFTGSNFITLKQSPVINGYIYSFGAPAHITLDNIGRIVVGDLGKVIRVDDMTGTNWADLSVSSYYVQGLSVGSDGTTYVAAQYNEFLFDDITTGAGFLTTSLVSQPGGIYAVPVPTPVPAITLVPTSMTFGNENTFTTSAPQNATLTNFGGAPLDITSIVPTHDFLVAADTCGSALPGGSNCTISISYSPTITGVENGTVTLTDNAASGTTQTISASGTGTAPVAGVAPVSLTFDAQAVSTTSGGQLVYLTNSGTGPMSFSGTGISTSGDFAQTNNCGAAVAPVTSCAVTVTFTPTATGTRTGTLYVSDNAGVQSVALTGTGASAVPTITVSPESLVFPTQLDKTKSAAQPVVLANIGTTAVSVTSVTITGDFSKAGSCPLKLAAAKSCTLNIAFTPTAAGTRTGTLTYNLSTGPVTVGLTGTGAATATGWLSISPSSFDFNNGYVVGDNPSQAFTVTNTNSVPAGITHISISGSTVFTQKNTCPTVLAANAMCTVTVTFAPTVVGTFTGTLNVTEGAGTQHKISLTGTAGTDN